MTGLKRTLRSRRGFTLVELVVVLVIAGITASFAVPALTGYIDNAKEKQAVSETQACVETVTRIAAQKYAEWQKNTTYQLTGGNELTSSAEFQPLVGCTGTTSNTPPTVTGGDVALTEGSGQYLLHVSNYGPGGFPATGSTADISAAASVTGTINTLTCSSSGQVVYLVYTSKDGITVVYTNNGRSSTVSTKADAVVVPTPGPDSSGGGGETSGGGTTGGGETGGGGTTGGGETGSIATAGEKQFIIHMQDVSTGNSTPFANKTYRITSGEHDFYKKSDSNGDILLDISPEKLSLQRPDTVIGDKQTTITEAEVPLGYQSIPSGTTICISVNITGNNDNDYKLGNIQRNDNYYPYVVDETNRRLTFMRFPVANLNLSVTDRDGKKLPGATFEILCDSKPVAKLTCDGNGECSIPVKLHDGDNIGKSDFLTAETKPDHPYVIKETYPPAGYQGDITCKFNLYYQPYPSEPKPHHETWFYINSNGYHGEWGSYELKKTDGKVEKEDSFHVINYERQLCTVYIRKIDDAGNAVSDANLKLTADNNRDAIVNTNVMEGFVSSKQFSTSTAVFEVRQGQSYTLEETNAPAGYTKADKLPFFVEPGCTKKEVTMIDHNSSEDKSDIKFDKVTFNQANNWAHKLTTDGKISFSGGEIICWKGIAYYNYEKDDPLTYNIKNNKRDKYKKADSTELNNAPDPMEFLSKHLKDKNPDKEAADYIVLLTGKAYRYNEENVTLQKGDIVIPEDYGDGAPANGKNKKVYVYIGDTDLPLTGQNLNDKNFTTLEHKPQDKDNKTYNFTLNQ